MFAVPLLGGRTWTSFATRIRRVQILDPSFAQYRIALAAVERIATGFKWAEGPVWLGDTRSLVWSDIPNDRMMRWDEETGATTVFRKPTGYSNGNTRDRQGRLVTCEHGGRRVSRTEYDGAITVLSDSFEGKRLNSPNDVVVKSDGSIWFTRPAIRHRRLLHGREGRTRVAARGLPHRPGDRRDERRLPTMPKAPTAWPFRPMSRSCMSSNRAGSRRGASGPTT